MNYEILNDAPAADENACEDPGELWLRDSGGDKTHALSGAITTARDVAIGNWLISQEIPLPTTELGWDRMRSAFYAMPYEEQSKWRVRPTRQMVDAARHGPDDSSAVWHYRRTGNVVSALRQMGRELTKDDVAVLNGKPRTEIVLESEMNLPADALREADTPLDWASQQADEKCLYESFPVARPHDPAKELAWKELLRRVEPTVRGLLGHRTFAMVWARYVEERTLEDIATAGGMSKTGVLYACRAATVRLHDELTKRGIL